MKVTGVNCFTTCSLSPISPRLPWITTLPILAVRQSPINLVTGFWLATALENYLGFFTILWFTWFETALFDVRFSSDSVLQRVFKALSFGVMTGLAATGAQFDTTRTADNFTSFRAMSLILMTSRIVIAAQYGVILWFVRGNRSAVIQLGLTILASLLTAMVFLGTFFDFYHQNAHAYIAWWVDRRLTKIYWQQSGMFVRVVKPLPYLQ